MCGICGQFNFASGKPVDEDTIRCMAASIAHRGPDDDGFFFSRELGLGFRRLSIIDLSAGHQPMSDIEERVWVVFNGEIYNFIDLRRELEGFGHIFRTRSDTEVIIYGYKQWGDDVLNHLNGMFGLAIWDESKRKLIIARDPMGIKAVYYHLACGTLIFGSEVRAILASGLVPREADPDAMNLFLRYRYTPSPLTAFRGIRKLAPGERLIARDGQVRIDRWWQYHPEPFDPAPSVARAEDELMEAYAAAVQRQLISDVPLGLLLSGGVDSALLLALMKKTGATHKTYTVGYGGTFADDELSDAADTARMLNAENYAVQLTREDFEAILPRVISIVEEPVASSSVVPMYYVCQRARQDVKVVLMGQGPDELMGGYRRHFGVRHGHWWRGLPGSLRAVAGSVMAAFPRHESWKRALYSLDTDGRMNRYKEVFSILPGGIIDGLFQDGVISAGCGERVLEFWSDLVPLMDQLDELGGFQFLEIRSSLPDELLLYSDKISMAHGLEARVPYLDLEVTRFAERLPAKYKVHGRMGKWLHKRVCARLLNERIIQRPKRGFAVNVVDQWYRDSMQGRMGTVLRDEQSLIYKYLRPAAVHVLVKDHLSGRQDNHKILFSLVVLEEWLRNLSSL